MTHLTVGRDKKTRGALRHRNQKAHVLLWARIQEHNPLAALYPSPALPTNHQKETLLSHTSGDMAGTPKPPGTPPGPTRIKAFLTFTCSVLSN